MVGLNSACDPHLTRELKAAQLLRARHMPFTIGIAERDQWLTCMKQAMAESNVDTTLAERLYASFFNTADWMRNRAGA